MLQFLNSILISVFVFIGYVRVTVRIGLTVHLNRCLYLLYLCLGFCLPDIGLYRNRPNFRHRGL